MPLITPPSFDESEPLPEEEGVISPVQYDRIKNYLDCPTWKCPTCGSIVFGRTLICPYNRHGNYCRTKKP